MSKTHHKTLRFELHAKQDDCLSSKATEILYGGAAGGGKSYLIRVSAVTLCMQVAGLHVYLFRRTFPDLIANHMNGSGSFPELLAPLVDSGQCKINYSSLTVEFENGSKIHMCHCQHEKDVTRYQGAEIHVLLIDELTHFSEYQYRFLRNRVRLGGLKIPDALRSKMPFILCASNPGGVGHQWVKATFINYAAPFELKRAAAQDGGMLRQYIPAKLSDNPTLTDNDPGYVHRLEGLGNESLVKAMRDGDWDIVAGAAFEKLSRDRHMVRPFPIPDHWTKFTSLDWGTAKPYACLWFAVNDEDVVMKANGEWPAKVLPKGSLIVYRELYGCAGNADTGTREESWEVARRVHELDKKEKIDYRIADSAMWAQHDGPSAAERFEDELVRLENGRPYMEKSRKGRVENYLEMRNRIAAEEGCPGIFIFSTCEHFWRTMPDLQLDQRDPEKGWDTAQEDHIADACGYGCVSRPITWTKFQRDKVDYEESREKALKAEHKMGSRY